MYYQKRRNQNKKYISYLLLVIVVIIFFATIGFKLLIGSVLFLVDITNIFTNKPTSVKKEYQVVIVPVLENFPVATNSALVNIAGTASPNNTIYISVNDEIQKKINLTNNNFSQEIQLIPGKNNIMIMSKDNTSGIEKKSKIYIINYINELPTLEIETPKDGTIEYRNNTNIIGQTDPEVIIKINSYPVVVDSAGKFSQNEQLQKGENTFEVTATDIAGNVTTKTLTINYESD